MLEHTVTAKPIQGPSPSGQSQEESEEAEISNAADGGDANASDDGDAGDGLFRQKWRIISAVEAWPHTGYFFPQCVDYSHDGGKVLKQMVRLINGVNPHVMWDHSDNLRDAAGYLDKAKWENSQDVPPGVNADLVIDPEFDAKAVKGLQSGLIRDGSVGINAEMTKSHPDMDDYDFYSQQGKMIDGEKVRWLPKKIASVRHMAMIPNGQGADPNAGLRNKSATQPQVERAENTTGGKRMDLVLQLLMSIASALKVDLALADGAEELPEGVDKKILERLQKVTDGFTEHAALSKQLTALEPHLVKDGEVGLSLKEIVERLPERLELAKHGDAFLVHQRKECVKAFDTANVDPEKPEQTDLQKKMRARIEASEDLDFLSEQLAYFQSIAAERFGLNQTSQVEANNPIGGGKTKPKADTGKTALIKESSRRMFKSGGEGK